MDESLVDIVLILLAALVAVAVIPTFDVELPVSTEVVASEMQLMPVQIAISSEGVFLYADEATERIPHPISAQQMYDLVADTHPNRIVEFTADQMAPAHLLVQANRIVQTAGREAVFLVIVDS